MLVVARGGLHAQPQAQTRIAAAPEDTPTATPTDWDSLLHSYHLARLLPPGLHLQFEKSSHAACMLAFSWWRKPWAKPDAEPAFDVPAWPQLTAPAPEAAAAAAGAAAGAPTAAAGALPPAAAAAASPAAAAAAAAVEGPRPASAEPAAPGAAAAPAPNGAQPLVDFGGFEEPDPNQQPVQPNAGAERQAGAPRGGLPAALAAQPGIPQNAQFTSWRDLVPATPAGAEQAGLREGALWVPPTQAPLVDLIYPAVSLGGARVGARGAERASCARHACWAAGGLE